MSDQLLSVEEVSRHLKLHPKTVLRYIRDGRLAAARVGKSYRIPRAGLDALTGLSGAAAPAHGARTTCVTDIAGLDAEAAGRVAAFLQSAAIAGEAGARSLCLQTAFDPLAGTLKAVVIGGPAEVGRLLQMLELKLGGRR